MADVTPYPAKSPLADEFVTDAAQTKQALVNWMLSQALSADSDAETLERAEHEVHQKIIDARKRAEVCRAVAKDIADG